MSTSNQLMTGRWFVVLLVMMLSIQPVMAAKGADKPSDKGIGKVIVSIGKVIALNDEGAKRQLKRRSPIFEGETIMTQEKSRTQVRFTDGSMLALKANSQFTIENYQYNPNENEGKAVYQLLKGGMQTITGAIGSQDKSNYEMKTPIATIGIRGTHYSLQLCQGDCRPIAGQVPADGLYGGVSKGKINVTNEQSSTDIGNDQYFHMPDANTPPDVGMTPPEVLTQEEPTESSQEEDEQSGDSEATEEDSSITDETTTNDEPTDETTDSTTESSTDTSTESTTTTTTSTTSTTTTDTTLTSPTYTVTDTFTQSGSAIVPRGTPAPNGVYTGIAFIVDSGTTDAHDIITDANHQVYLENISGVGNVPVYLEVYDTDCTPCQWVVSDTATLTDVGGSSIGVNWGRWVGGSLVADGQGTQSVAGDNFHYIYSDKPWFPNGFTGSVSFSLFGGTRPTDQFGNTYDLDSASANVDFGANNGAGALSLQFSITGGGTSYHAVSDRSYGVDDAIRNGVSLVKDGSTNSPSLSGQATVQFIGTGTAPDGMASSYGISASDGKDISGVMYLQ